MKTKTKLIIGGAIISGLAIVYFIPKTNWYKMKFGKISAAADPKISSAIKNTDVNSPVNDSVKPVVQMTK